MYIFKTMLANKNKWFDMNYPANGGKIDVQEHHILYNLSCMN